MPVQVRRGALIWLCTAVRAARTRSSKPASRVRLPGGTPTACIDPVMPHGVARISTSLPGWRSWKRRRLLIVLPQVRILPLVQRRRQVERAQPSEGSACWFESSRRYDLWSGTHLGSEAAVYRPRRVRFSSGPLSTPGYPNQIEDAGSDPVCCRCKSCPWYRRARSTTAVQPPDERPTRGSTPPAPTPGSSGEARWL